MKKFLSLCLAVIFCAGLCVGCGTGKNGDASSMPQLEGDTAISTTTVDDEAKITSQSTTTATTTGTEGSAGTIAEPTAKTTTTQITTEKLTTTTAMATTTTARADDGMDKEKTYRFLFIGNSYTHYNELWTMFKNVAESVGYSVEVDQVTRGGAYLSQYADSNHVDGQLVEQKLSENTYDYVFLQEQSLCPILDFDRFRDAVKTLYTKIKATGAKVILYQTWARQLGSSDLANNGWTVEEMYLGLRSAYEKVGAELDVPVSPVGTAFYDMTVSHPEVFIYHLDKTHPSKAGTYLAALCHFAVVTGENPLAVPYTADLNEKTVSLLKASAQYVVYFEGK